MQLNRIIGKNRFIFSITLWTWLISSIIGIVFLFIFLKDTSDLEWFGTPTFGMLYLILLVTAFYFIFRNKALKPSIVIIIWLVLLFLATTVSMIALAYSTLGIWEDFQAMPLMGTFQFVLWAVGIHFSLQNRSRKPLYLLALWTLVLFLTTLTTMLALGFGLFQYSGWEDWQIYPIIGTGIWSALIIVAYFGLKKPTISWIDALFYFGWSMCIGIGISMVSLFFNLLRTEKFWPLFVFIKTFGFETFFTILKYTIKRPIFVEKQG